MRRFASYYAFYSIFGWLAIFLFVGLGEVLRQNGLGGDTELPQPSFYIFFGALNHLIMAPIMAGYRMYLKRDQTSDEIDGILEKIESQIDSEN